MEVKISIRRDVDGSTEEVEADVTLTDEAVNIHPKATVQLSKDDVLILPRKGLQLEE